MKKETIDRIEKAKRFMLENLDKYFSLEQAICEAARLYARDDFEFVEIANAISC